jgi:hypothetical protein
MLFIIICLSIHFLFVSFSDLNSAHAQNEYANCVFYFSESPCPVRHVNKSGNLNLIFAFLCFFILWNDCYCVSIECDTVSSISDDIHNKRILSFSITFLGKSFKFIKNFLSQINLLHLSLVSNIENYIVILIIQEKSSVFLGFLLGLIDFFK